MPSTATSLETLHDLRNAIDTAISIISDEWSEHGAPPGLHDPAPIGKESLLSHRLYDATRLAIGAAGMLQVLLKDPRDYLTEVTSQYFESRAMHAVQNSRIPDIIYEATLEGKNDGLTTEEIAEKAGWAPVKCARLMRLLASSHIFNQTGPDRYTNNRTSGALIHNDALYNYLGLHTAWFGAGYQILEDVKDQSLGWDNSPLVKDPLVNPNHLTFWPLLDATPHLHEMFGTAMAGHAQSKMDALMADYPWDKLGNTTLVDVGGGVGAFTLPLLARYPNLSVIIQDRAPVISQAQEYWKANLSSALDAGRTDLQAADFFQPNPVKGADVYILRYILHDWNDDESVRIVSAIKSSMTATSRLFIVETLVIPTLADESSPLPEPAAPYPLPANYGHAHRFTHNVDMMMYSLYNGTERTVATLTAVVQRAGLKIAKIWPCRSAMYITECVLAD